MDRLLEIAHESRKIIFDIVCKNKAGHLASSLSSVEILTELYFDNILKFDSKNPEYPMRDRFILSKGHSALGYYVTLALAGYFDIKEINDFCIAGTKYGGLPLKGKIKGIEATTGSLGHGLSFASGIAITAKIKKMNYRVFCMIGDGECQEGSIWEAALFIAQNKLNNLVIIVDNNGIQATGRTNKVINLESIKEKWNAFGFYVLQVNGHDFFELREAFRELSTQKMPTVIIANTIKGKGLSFVEDHEQCHYKIPDEKQIIIGKKELGIGD